jgi:NhaP-type Na+/H+ or K+/H+ antiporter
MAETLLTLAAPYVAWLAAESLHVSAVLRAWREACTCAGTSPTRWRRCRA